MSDMTKFEIPCISDYEVSYRFEDGENTNSATCPFHLHDSLEIYIILEGDASFAVGSSIYRLSAGDAIIIKPNEMHSCISVSDRLHRSLCLWYECGSEFLFGDFLSHGIEKNSFISPDGEAKEELFKLCAELDKAADATDIYNQFHDTLQILCLLRRFISREAIRQRLPDALTGILEDIDEHFTEIRGIEDIISKHFISRSTLNRMFREYMHTSPKKYIEYKRLAYSRRLLKEGKTVLDACTEAGFSDCSNYIQLFKKHFSMTPRQYRNEKYDRLN